MVDADSTVCHYHKRQDSRLEPLVGYWIDVENNGHVVGYVCSIGAEILRAAESLHDFRDAYRLKYPQAVFVKRESKIDGTRETNLVISDTE